MDENFMNLGNCLPGIFWNCIKPNKHEKPLTAAAGGQWGLHPCSPWDIPWPHMARRRPPHRPGWVGRAPEHSTWRTLSASLRCHCRPGLYKPSPWLQADKRPGGLWSLTTCKINRPKGVPLHGRAAGGWAGNTRQASKFPSRSSKSPFISNDIFPEIFSK